MKIRIIIFCSFFSDNEKYTFLEHVKNDSSSFSKETCIVSFSRTERGKNLFLTLRTFLIVKRLIRMHKKCQNSLFTLQILFHRDNVQRRGKFFEDRNIKCELLSIDRIEVPHKNYFAKNLFITYGPYEMRMQKSFFNSTVLLVQSS